MDTHYDFVIVGGGLSSLVVAARLTEDPKVSVLVVEAGQDHSSTAMGYSRTASMRAVKVLYTVTELADVGPNARDSQFLCPPCPNFASFVVELCSASAYFPQFLVSQSIELQM